MHEGNQVREFYSQLPRPVLVGIEATGSMHWFLNLMDELGIACQVGHRATIRAAESGEKRAWAKENIVSFNTHPTQCGETECTRDGAVDEQQPSSSLIQGRSRIEAEVMESETTSE